MVRKHAGRLGAIVVLSGILAGCTTTPDHTVEDLLASRPDRFQAIVENAELYRLQILISEVVPGENGRETVRRHSFRADREYFYPASAIKLCAAVAAVKLAEHLDGVELDTPLVIHPLLADEAVQEHDPSNLGSGRITIGHEIRKLFLVSDNQAFNRLYDIVGHEALNRTMTDDLGLSSVVINHRLSSNRTGDLSLRAPRIEFSGAAAIDARTSPLQHLSNRNARGIRIGRGYVSGEQVHMEPMDFSGRNGISLRDLQDLLIMVVRPDLSIGKPRIDISAADRQFLLAAMSEYPRTSRNPTYSETEFPDDYGKFLLPGLTRVCEQASLKVYNKVGQAYGFTVENAYVVDQSTDRSFFLTAVIYTNADGILNDDRYEYDSVALPFMADLGEAAARCFLRPVESPPAAAQAERSAK